MTKSHSAVEGSQGAWVYRTSVGCGVAVLAVMAILTGFAVSHGIIGRWAAAAFLLQAIAGFVALVLAAKNGARGGYIVAIALFLLAKVVEIAALYEP